MKVSATFDQTKNREYARAIMNAAVGSPLPDDSAARKNIPLCTGVFDYFPAALAEVAKVSKAGNDKHNPGEALHHARGKSTDHADCILRHMLNRGGFDKDGMRESALVVWRALALLQEELEAEGAPLARGARLPEPQPPLLPLRHPASHLAYVYQTDRG